MDCQRIDAILDAHAVKVLSAAERSEVDSHLEGCPRCSDALLSYEILTGETPAAPPAGMLAEMLASARTADGPVVAPRAARRLVSMLALAAMVLIVAGFVGLRFLAAWPSIEAWNGGSTLAQRPSKADRPTAEQTVAPVALAGALAAGRHYEKLAVPAPTSSAPGRIEVAEFFTFGCGHCFDLEPELGIRVEAMPAYVDFVRVPAIFDATARLHARAFYAAEALGRLDDFVEPFYEEIHVRGNPLASASAVKDFFSRQGIDGRRFDEVFGSLAVEVRLRRAEELARLYHVSATPSFGVNGKYLTDPSMAGSNRMLLDIVDALVASEAGRLCPGQGGSQCPLH